MMTEQDIAEILEAHNLRVQRGIYPKSGKEAIASLTRAINRQIARPAPAEAKRWSGYESQPLPWRKGYEWAYDRGPHGTMGIDQAIEADGYDFDSEAAGLWMKGVDFAHNEKLDI